MVDSDVTVLQIASSCHCRGGVEDACLTAGGLNELHLYPLRLFVLCPFFYFYFLALFA